MKNIARFIAIIITLFASGRVLHAGEVAAEPDTFFFSSPSAYTNSAIEILSFDSIAPNGLLRYEGQLDGGGFTEVPDVVALSGLSDGPHTYEVRAVDDFGLVDQTPASVTWIVDTMRPSVLITNGPSSLTSETSAQISINGDDGGGSGVVGFEGSLDGSPFAPVSDPVNLSGLADGLHTFSVRAVDAVGNVSDTPASISWTVDVTAPDTFITNGPSGLTASTDAAITFNGEDGSGSGAGYYEGSLDGAPFTPVLIFESFIAFRSIVGSGFSEQTVNLNGLADGPHTYEVRAVDAAGNVDPTPASTTWTVDATAPDTFITVGPSGTTSNTSAEIYFDGDDGAGSGVASFEGSLDGEPYTPMSSPAFYEILSEGEHTFSVRAIDTAGNVDPTPATITWTVNATLPNNAPTDITLSNATIAENNAPGATIGTLSATDADSGDTHTFTFAESVPAFAPAPDGAIAFRAIAGNDNANFTIAGNVLSINSSADFETKSSYNVRIKVTDNGNPTASFEKNFTITITDVTIPQAITFAAIPDKTFGAADFTVSATGGASGQPVTFVASGAATITGDLVHITGVGSVIISASQAGAGDYEAAEDVERFFTVAPAEQTIVFNPAPTALQTETVTLSATGGASGEPVTFIVVSGPGSIFDGIFLNFSADGPVVVRASQAGGGNYLAAPDVEATITVGTPSNLPAVDDAVTLTTGDATLYPLANDGNPNATIVSVDTGIILESFPSPGLAFQPVESGVIIDGRKLIVPADFSEPSFTYTTSDGYTATVRVFTDRPVVGARRFAGLLHDLDGKIVGIMQASSSSNGTFLSTLKIGARTVIAKFQLTAGTKTVTTSFGSLTITRDEYGRLVVTLDNGQTAFTGNLRPCKNTAAIAQHNVALASIHEAIPGGGYIQAFTKLNGDIILVGKLPDGRPFSAKSRLADNGTFAIYNSINSTAPKGYCAGELVAANLVKTDLTGELVWTMPAQARSPHATGVDTVLTANGCMFTPGATLPNGSCTIVVSGGNFAASSSIASTITAGSPAVSALVRSWRVTAIKGSFTAIVKDPARTKAVGARGIYLPKSNSAWGYFPGTSVGGRIELTQSLER